MYSSSRPGEESHPQLRHTQLSRKTRPASSVWTRKSALDPPPPWSPFWNGRLLWKPSLPTVPTVESVKAEGKDVSKAEVGVYQSKGQ